MIQAMTESYKRHHQVVQEERERAMLFQNGNFPY
jgi:hypothetical protein